MLQHFRRRDSLRRLDDQHPLQKVHEVGILVKTVSFEFLQRRVDIFEDLGLARDDALLLSARHAEKAGADRRLANDRCDAALK